MNSSNLAHHPRLEVLLAKLLDKGTWIACLFIGLGIVVVLLGAPASSQRLGISFVAVGIATFIALPILRVTLMATVFLRERDYLMGLIAMSVLLIIALGAAVGVGFSKSRTRNDVNEIKVLPAAV